jgi:uncharacterized protein
MTISMYEASVPVLLRGLGTLDVILGKAAAHAEARKFDPAVLVGARLYPDMFPLSRQVQICSDTAKGGAARLAGVEVPKYEDTETTIPELRARIDKTMAFLRTLERRQFDGSEDRDIALQMRTETRHFKGQPYLLGFVLPNFYFHSTTTYAILRHNGVELGKGDFLGPVP